MSEFTAGATFSFAYPFIIEDFNDIDEDGPHTVKSWRPGTRVESCGPEDTQDVADGVGEQTVTIVSIHRPGRFPTRIFYTRQWRTPAGKAFGKSRLMVKTQAAFRSLIRGYRYSYDLPSARLPLAPANGGE